MKNKLKIILGIAVSISFLFLAFRQVNLHRMLTSIENANILALLAVLFFVLLSAWLRAVRWRYFLLPIKKIDMNSLFSSLMIGYATNFILPAHLGELVRAYVLGRKKHISSSSAFATIVSERIIDMMTLLIIMTLTLFLYPFPHWVKQSGYLMFALTIVIIVILILLKLRTEKTTRVIRFLLKPLPDKISLKILDFLTSFLKGFVGLKNWKHYIAIFILSILIWAGYTIVFALGLLAFGFQLPWIAPLVLMVITTISIVVPSSPGYIGTYHLLCQLSLGFFGVGKSTALGFAFVIHGLNTIPFLILGLAYAWKEGINISKMSKSQKIENQTMTISQEYLN